MKGGSLASENVMKNIDIGAFKALNKHMTNVFTDKCGGSNIKQSNKPKRIGKIIKKEEMGNVHVSNCKKGGSLLSYSPVNYGKVSNKDIFNRNASSDKFLANQPINSIPALNKTTVYGTPVDGGMPFSYTSNPVNYTIGGSKKKTPKGKIVGKIINITCDNKNPKKKITCTETKTNIYMKDTKKNKIIKK